MSEGNVEEYKIIAPAISTAGVYYFNTDSDINYEVRFGRRQDNILHATIVFGVTNDEFEGEEYTVTNKGELYRVMTTIVHVVKMFMAEHPKMVTYEFTGLAKEDEPEDKLTSRINLYKRYLPRIFDKDWKFDYSRGNTIIVSRIK
ncbi:MAG: hypothetical protein ACXVPU_05540 [Bacteroidia bacterium]